MVTPVESPSNNMSRRQWLQLGAFVIAGQLPFRGPAGSNIHVSLAAYSMRQSLLAGEIDLFDFLDWCSRLKLAGAELTSYYFPEDVDADYLRRLKRHAARQGLSISGTAVRNDFCLPPGPARQRELDHVRRWIDYAAEMGAPHIRVFAGDVPQGVTREAAIGRVAASVNALLDYAEQRAVTIGLENHGGITARVKEHLAICRLIGPHPWFGINLDTGNYRTAPYDEMEAAAPWAVNVQYKVDIYTAQGNVPTDMKRVARILRSAGYNGWLALEYEADGNPWEEIPVYLRRLQEVFENGQQSGSAG